MIEIRVLGKPDCHLCDVAKRTIRDVSTGFDVTVRDVDIRDDAELERRYRWDIPIVLVDGSERFRHRVDPDDLRQLLTALSASDNR